MTFRSTYLPTVVIVTIIKVTVVIMTVGIVTVVIGTVGIMTVVIVFFNVFYSRFQLVRLVT